MSRSGDADCVALLRDALPRLGLRWEGFRRVRRQVCRRIDRRCRELGLDGLAAYRERLETHPDEWAVLDRLCRVTISRYRRDRAVWVALERDVLPALAAAALRARRRTVRAWSSGCASGEEAYTLALSWHFAVAPRFPGLRLRVLATDVDDTVLERARRACYPPGSLRELPATWRAEAFVERDGLACLLPAYREGVHLARHDVRRAPRPGPFDLVLCRNLAFTYFADDVQREVGASLATVLRPGGALVVGVHEELPDGVGGLEPWPSARSVYLRS